MAEALLIRLAHEEIIYLLRALDIAQLGNLTPETLGDLDDDHRALAMAIADRSLRARAMVHWKDVENRDVDGVVAGVLRACAAPRFTLEIDARRSGQLARQFRYTFSERVAIEQVVAEPGIYQFLTTISASDVLRQLRLLLQLDETADQPLDAALIPVTRYSIPFHALTAARDSVITDPASARSLLADALPEPIAASLIEAFVAPIASYSLSFHAGPAETGQPAQLTHNVASSREPREQRWLTVLQSAPSCWLLRRDGDVPKRVEVSIATTAQALREVEALARPALALLAPTDEREGVL